MQEALQFDADVSIHGSQTRLRGVKAPGTDHRPWIASFPVCQILNQHQMAHVGLMEAVAPYRIVRRKQTSTYFVACYGGRGRVLIDGQWRDCTPGMAFLLPAEILNAFHAAPGGKWEFCWVCYVQPIGQRRICDSISPVLARYDDLPLRSAILGLIHECQGRSVPAALQHWVELIQEYVSRFAQPENRDQRLLKLWERVAAHLGENWTLGRLAQEAGYSREHLRRLCRQEIGRSPMHQVIYLRMRRAAELLSTTREKIETVAQAVGYKDPFVFSKAFHKCIGWPPSNYRINQPLAAAQDRDHRRLAVRGRAQSRLKAALLLLAWTLGGDASEKVPSSADPSVSESRAAILAPAGPFHPASNVVPGDPETQDRSLRKEQLQIAGQLYAEFPQNADAACALGYVSNEQGDSAGAIHYWEEALRLPAQGLQLYNRADTCYNLGYAYLLREDYAKAVAFLRESLTLNPRRNETHYRLAHALFLSGRMEESLRVLEDGKIETPLACRLRGQANQQLGRLEEARRNYETAVRLDSGFAEAYYGLATTCSRLGDTAKADEYRRRFEALKSQGQAMGRQARTDFNPLALTRRSVAQTHTEIARAFMARGQPQRAEKL